MILTLDWAAKFTAGMVRDHSGLVQHQFDSWGKDIFEFSEEVATIAAEFDVVRVVIEDVPYGIKSQFMVKPVLRAQGVLMDELNRVDMLERSFFLPPAEWQRFFGIFKGGPKAAEEKARELGYTSAYRPDLLIDYAGDIPEKGPARSKVRAQLKKAMTDYDDAFLIGQWTLDVGEEIFREKTKPADTIFI
jgi:hypothetical protein